MRIAVVSDIHGNLPALEAVADDVRRHAPNQIWCGGDLGWAGPWASECIEFVRDAGWTTVKGNTDVWITGDPQTISEPEQRDAFARLAEAHAIGDDAAAWLLELPLGHSGPGSILLIHGTPASPFVAPTPDAPASEFVPYEGQAGLVVYGHVHQAFARRLADGTIVCNPGSVGLPMDDETASYLLIDQNGPDWTLQHRRVAYDRERALDEARRLGGPIRDHFLDFMGVGT